jgi:hypothetical protein
MNLILYGLATIGFLTLLSSAGLVIFCACAYRGDEEGEP